MRKLDEDQYEDEQNKENENNEDESNEECNNEDQYDANELENSLKKSPEEIAENREHHFWSKNRQKKWKKQNWEREKSEIEEE